jgi:glycosyltransferase involved in cell wall biosynthesis
MGMILVDSLYVNSGGGKILLDQLVKEFISSKLDVQFLFDRRVLNYYDSYEFVNEPIYLKASLLSRLNFYKNNINVYSVVLTFGNIPPPIKLNVPVFTYLHNVLYLEKYTYLKFKDFALLKAKLSYIKWLKRNTNYWIVQTNNVKFKLSDKWGITLDQIYTLPFYNEFVPNIHLDKNERGNNIIRYLYVSNGENYKNHKLVFRAFEIFCLKNRNVELMVTLSEDYPDLINKIIELQKKGVLISNIGIVDKSLLNEIYKNTDFVIFPSLFESFGLGLIEAAQFKLPILAADCDYVKEVVVPSLTFLPTDLLSIINALECSLRKNLQPSKLVVKNQIKELVLTISNYK